MKLNEVIIKGFKSIDSQGQAIPFGDITVLLGANGSGKSNLVSFFKMLNYITTGGLQNYVAKQGASQLLFYGSKVTESTSFSLHFSSESIRDKYEMKLSYGLPDRLFISGEAVSYHDTKHYPLPQTYYLDAGSTECGITADSRETSRIIHRLLSNIRTYQFHDTSDTAKIKNRGYIDDVAYLRSDGGNLAAFLRILKTDTNFLPYYRRIIRHIQKIMPQFGDFILDSVPGNENYVRLNWNDATQSDYLFGPDQISDGSLRFMALTTLLLQPPQLLPKFIVLDEPELGLHPAAIAELAGMIHMICENTQILIATQSTRLVDEFSADQVLVVELDKANHSSQYRKLSPEILAEWIEDYSLSELWEKNVLGGQP